MQGGHVISHHRWCVYPKMYLRGSERRGTKQTILGCETECNLSHWQTDETTFRRGAFRSLGILRAFVLDGVHQVIRIDCAAARQRHIHQLHVSLD